MLTAGFQSALRLIYPPRCTICGCQVDSDFGLCGPCWRDTPFVTGLCCDTCGIQLPGQAVGRAEFCDDCLVTARPWKSGRAVVLYRDNGRKLALALKHGDRQDIVRPASVWMARTAQPLLTSDMLIVPIPLHWTRLLKRRFNQAALLAQAVSKEVALSYCPDVLTRPAPTPTLGGLGRDARHQTMDGKISVHKGRNAVIADRDVLLIDDVMTSGATLSAATQACHAAGAANVSILVLARAGKGA